MADKCSGITKAGNRCPTTALPGRPYCLFHDPQAADLRRAGAVKGGQGKSNQARARKGIPDAMAADELGGYLSLLFKGVMGGRIEARVGTAAATIARALLEVRNVTEIETRLAELEAAAGIDERRRA